MLDQRIQIVYFQWFDSAKLLPFDAMVRQRAIFGGVATPLLVCLAVWFAWSGRIESFRPSRPPGGILRSFESREEFVPPRVEQLPSVYLWAWERPEDLRFLAGKSIGVAFLAKTLFLRGRVDARGSDAASGVEVRPRMQPLHVSTGTPLMAVVRIETPRGAVAAAYQQSSRGSEVFSAKQVARATEEIAQAARLPGVNAVQIDFDATRSEQALYLSLLTETRKRIPANTPLSITALASWCIGDRWLDQLPTGTIDEAVPMLFRMGPGGAEIVNFVRSGKEFPRAVCKSSLGICTDEAFSRAILSGELHFARDSRAPKRIYLFPPQRWDPVGTTALLQEISQ